MKYVKVIQNIGDNEEHEITFSSDVMPMAIHYAETWVKRNGYKLVKSPAKIAELFPACHRVACNKNEKIFYVI